MSLSILCEPKQDYLQVSVTGVFSLPEANSLFLRILNACAEHRLSKALVDFRSIQGSLSATEDFQYGKFIALAHASHVEKGFPRIKFAYLGARPFATPKGAGELAAVSRSLDAMVTTDPDEALTWLGVDLSGADSEMRR